MSSSLKKANDQSNFSFLPVDAYLLNAMNNSPKDRDFVIRVEGALLGLLKDTRQLREDLTFSDLNSYYRMLVHRVARYYDLERHADSLGRTVTIFHPPSNHTRPILKLTDFVEPLALEPVIESTPPAPVKKFTIMKRNTDISADKMNSELSTKSTRTLEDREREYDMARARIFESLNLGEQEEERELEDFDFRQHILVQKQDDNIEDEEVNSPEEILHFKGWEDIESIKPFIPNSTIIPVTETTTLDSCIEDDFDFDSIWIPQHIFIVEGVPVEESNLKSIKSICKKNACKLYRHPSGNVSLGLLLFNYKVGQSEDAISKLIGASCSRWRPFYLPEPPL